MVELLYIGERKQISNLLDELQIAQSKQAIRFLKAEIDTIIKKARDRNVMKKCSSSDQL